jgi:hypothetical protein
VIAGSFPRTISKHFAKSRLVEKAEIFAQSIAGIRTIADSSCDGTMIARSARQDAV